MNLGADWAKWEFSLLESPAEQMLGLQWKEQISTEELPPSDWHVAMFVGQFVGCWLCGQTPEGGTILGQMDPGRIRNKLSKPEEVSH